jgi:hypothetical protein
LPAPACQHRSRFPVLVSDLERFREGAKESLSASASSSDLQSVGKLLAGGSLAAAISGPGEGPLLARLPAPKEPAAGCAHGCQVPEAPTDILDPDGDARSSVALTVQPHVQAAVWPGSFGDTLETPLNPLAAVVCRMREAWPWGARRQEKRMQKPKLADAPPMDTGRGP